VCVRVRECVCVFAERYPLGLLIIMHG